MPATRRSMGSSALQEQNKNVVKAPNTPSKQVKNLTAQLEKKDAENSALQDTIAQLTNALGGLNLVKEKMNQDVVVSTDNAKKNKKDKDAPAPAKTAYKFFCESNSKPDVDMRQVWKEAAPEIRQLYTQMAEQDKARFAEEMAVYEEEKFALEFYQEKKKQDQAMEFYEAHLKAQAALDQANAGKQKKTKDPEAPKRPTSSYMYFATENRESVKAKHANASVTEISTILGEMWNKLEKGKKGKKGTKKYDDMAAKDQERYASEKAQYDAMIAERKAQAEKDQLEMEAKEKEEAMKLFQIMSEASATVTNEAAMSNLDDNMSVISGLTTDSKKKKKKDPNAPKHPMSAYLYFCNENREGIKSKMPDATNKELLTEVGRQWKELSDKKKAKYNKMAEKDKERYAKEMAAYSPAN